MCSHDKYKLYQNTLQHIKQRTKQEYYINQCNKFRNNTTKLWKVLNEVLPKSNDKDSVSILKANGTNYYSKSAISSEFADYFANIGNNLSNNIPNGTHSIDYYLQRISRNARSLFITPCTEIEIERILSSLKNKPSSGYDDISNKMLKIIGNSLLTPLYHIFNESLRQGVFPLEMKNALVVPLYKSGPPCYPNNYRPISLLITLSKILEKLMYKKVYDFLDWNKQIFKSQYGFQSKHSCEQAVTELIGNILKGFESNKHSIAIFLDLSKVFDMLNHNILLSKME